MNDIYNLLKNNPYPGRGIIIGCSEDLSSIVTLYFIMGRSVNSRNRVFEKTTDGIRTKAHDPKKLTDPSLIIYAPVRVFDNRIIVTNGDQTDTIYEHLSQGSDFRTAILTREYEPDAPNYTPRISSLVEPDGSYRLSIIKRLGATGVETNGLDTEQISNTNQCVINCQHNFFEYSNPIPGLGHFISTYQTDGDPLPPFIGEPIPISIKLSDGLENFANKIWTALSKENKVSLYARQTEISSGDVREVIINKNTVIAASEPQSPVVS